MFVQSVVKQTGSIKIKTQGWVKTQASIDKLKNAGILDLEIDPDKTLTTSVPKKASATAPAAVKKHNPWQKTHSATQEMGKAKKLYNEAKTLQQKAFKEIKAGRDIDIAPFRELASGFMDSVFRNQDALACLTQMRQKDAYLLEHSINVSILMSIFAKHLGVEKEIIEELTTGALLHDIGKIKIRKEIVTRVYCILQFLFILFNYL
jgi:HD-GYP domain-containing protein (c-di-GMP phosphodiesterase class II)